jgi:predicted flap endonuclease-1-like 5' DNA nuclease
MAYPLEKIEGIGPAYAAKLLAAGMKDTGALLTRCRTPKDRAAVAAASGISAKLILEFANRADLMRIKGVGEEFSDLLEAAGVDTVPELAQRKPENLVPALAKAATGRVRKAPTLAQVKAWVEHAKTLERALEY